jgi:hypothetical protein
MLIFHKELIWMKIKLDVKFNELLKKGKIEGMKDDKLEIAINLTIKRKKLLI